MTFNHIPDLYPLGASGTSPPAPCDNQKTKKSPDMAKQPLLGSTAYLDGDVPATGAWLARSREEQRKKVKSSMDVTELGMVTSVREEQSKKAENSMDVTELGMVTSVREEQSSKALPPMEVTESGMVTSVREGQLEKV